MIEPLMGRHFHMIAMVFQCPLECISPSIGEAFASIGEAFPHDCNGVPMPIRMHFPIHWRGICIHWRGISPYQFTMYCLHERASTAPDMCTIIIKCTANPLSHKKITRRVKDVLPYHLVIYHSEMTLICPDK